MRLRNRRCDAGVCLTGFTRKTEQHMSSIPNDAMPKAQAAPEEEASGGRVKRAAAAARSACGLLLPRAGDCHPGGNRGDGDAGGDRLLRVALGRAEEEELGLLPLHGVIAAARHVVRAVR